MRWNNSVFCIFILSWPLVACARPIQQEITSAIVLNYQAKDLLEWETSANNPKQIFLRLQEKFKTSKKADPSVCQALSLLPSHELSVFEEEIRRPANQNLLIECRAFLKKNLEDYWLQQKLPLPSPKPLFRFHTRVEKRDLSKGYRAATGDVQPKELILTFDDGPSAENTLQILNVLRWVHAKGMFFNIGPQVQENPSIVYRAALDGHVIGSHSMTHRCLANNAICAKANGGTPLGYDEAIAEIRGGHQAIYDLLQFVDPFFRFPFGESDLHLTRFLASKQVAQFYWSIDSQDWRIQSNQELLQNVLAQVDKNQRGIILFHDTQRRTLEILPAFLRAIYQRGYSLVILQALDEKARYQSQLVTKEGKTP